VTPKLVNVGIVGATGAVGQELLGLLAERRFPVNELRLFASPTSEGRKLSALGAEHTVRAAGPEGFEGLELVFFSAGSGTSLRLAPHAIEAGARVVDNSSAFRMNEGVPLVIPEINGDALGPETTIAAVPNCSAIMLLMGIAPLRRLGRIRRVIVSTYQAASGAGARAMQELLDQTAAALEGRELKPSALPHPIAFNLFCHDSPIGEDGRNDEERKMEEESRKILGDPELSVTATCIRVPVLRAHSESACVEFDRAVSEQDARQALSSAAGVVVVDDRKANRFPMPIDAAGKDEVLVGRIRGDMYNDKALNLLISGDQLRKGAALNSIQIAEALLRFPRAGGGQ
jgi:aspartate-semialdehyde dehydrogenase